MQQISTNEIRGLAADIVMELERLKRLEEQVRRVTEEIQIDPARADLFYESLALKLHNFYTGCERIFRLVATELDGSLPSGQDWHRRLLERMSADQEERRAVISLETARKLQEYLGFRHVVRNLYGFELESERIARLVESYPIVWSQVERDILAFIDWLQSIAAALENE